MSRRKRIVPQPSTTENIDVKITMKSVYASPEGTAVAGQVIDASEAKAKELLDKGHARPYDAKRDSKAQHGITTAPGKFEV